MILGRIADRRFQIPDSRVFDRRSLWNLESPVCNARPGRPRQQEGASVVQHRRGPIDHRPRLALGLASIFTVLVAAGAGPATPEPERAAIRLTDAAERGAFNVGAARAEVGVADDPAEGRVLTLDYTLPQGTAAGVWTKGFPAGLNAGNIDVVQVAIEAADPRQAGQVTIALEIKGQGGVQRIPLDLRPGWTSLERAVDWPAIGEPKEVVVSVARAGDGPPAVGSIKIDVRFLRLPWLRKLSTERAVRVGGVALASLLAALLAILARWASATWAGRGPEPSRTELAWPQALGRDFVLGLGTVAIVCLALGIDVIGGMGPLEIGWSPAAMALAGVALAEWWKFGLTGRHLTPGETLRDGLITGWLAASAAPLAILQAPAEWSDLLLLSQPAAATFAFLYHAINARRLASSGKHLSGTAGALIVGAPYAVGGLLVLEADALAKSLGSTLTAGALAGWPAAAGFVGRTVALFLVNELVANALALATKRTLLRSALAHLTLLAVAVAAVAGPWVASFGSGATVASWPALARLVAVVASTAVSQAGLWGEAYLLTGLVLDAIRGAAPSRDSTAAHPTLGMKKAMVYGGTFLGGLNVLALLAGMPIVRRLVAEEPLALAMLAGAVAFPLVKTIIETFDGSQAFFRRVAQGYRKPALWVRGAVVGLGVGYGLSRALPQAEMAARIWFGLGVGVAAFAGINLVRDALAARQGRGRVQSWRVYLVQGLLGGSIGAAIGFYLDAAQVAVIVAKYHRYVDPAQAPQVYDVYPLLSKWGFIRLGETTGGSSLLFAEALAGVISWSIPSWLFAINRTLMAAYFDKDAAQIKGLFSGAGLVQLVENMIGVLRWGLWMSPIINSFLRPMGEPTWYNQDGAIRTAIAAFHDASSTPSEFGAWSLGVFIALLAYDWVRILIWLDHMGLRVATLVNLSFLGMDRLDRRLSRFLAPAATARCIPEAVKRFTTWAPLLIPFYIPRGKDWDLAWAQAEAIHGQGHGGLLEPILAMSHVGQLLLALGSVVAATMAFAGARWLRERRGVRGIPAWTLENTEYQVTLRGNGEALSQVKGRGYDVSRRSYDLLDPAGRALFLVEDNGDADRRAWPVIGNAPGEPGEATAAIERDDERLRVVCTRRGIRATVEITLPAPGDAAELWTITVENLADAPRQLKVVPYLEWVLNRPEADRSHTQYNRLFAEVEYAHGLHAVLAWDKHAKAMGVLASDVAPEGFLSARVDFIGRARSVWTPRVVETLAFREARDSDAHPTFDPIGSLLLPLSLPARGSATVRILIGMTTDKRRAIDLVARHLGVPTAGAVSDVRRRKASHPIGHGEVPPGTHLPYTEFSDDGRRLLVRTPFTTRPFDHTLANARGHVLAVTNRGLHTSASVNAQQNRLTPDWSDTVTREVPAEAFYLYDPDAREWFSPTYHPINDASAAHEAEFGVDGSATFRMTKGTLETELTLFVPPDELAGVYRLTVRNLAEVGRRIRVAPYFQMVLAGQPEYSGPLAIRRDPGLNALFFENPRNTFRWGPAFVALSCEARVVETSRGRFFGAGRDVGRPSLVERGEPDPSPIADDRPVAAFLAELVIPGGGEATIVVVLGQAGDRAEAEAVIRKYRDPDAAADGLEVTRRWWLSLMDTLSVQTGAPEFDRYLDWLKYQALAERIWARRGFYQASGAFGFRDQLQDAVNLIWMDPALARRQILLHASQQFLEGDVVHWFHLLQDGRTGFVGRTHASDNPLWLAWAVVEYVGATGDDSLLDERTPYLESDLPFEPLPAGKGGMGFDPLRSSWEDTVYRHAMKAIDLVLDRRMGAHGLPLMGTGDWNDGLDEIGSEGRGESVWLGFFLYYILDRMIGIVERREGVERREHYERRLRALKEAIELTWRGDRYLRAFHDDGTEIGVAGSGVWEIDALTAAWAVMSGINPERGRVVFETALRLLERENTILLGWPPLREDTKPYLGRSSWYPEGVRENGMYCHGVQWLVGAARLLAEGCERQGQADEARRYRETATRLWRKTSAIPHAEPGAIETYGGQPNQQAADLVTTFDPGRMIWNGYTGSAGWVFRQALEGVLGFHLDAGVLIPPADLATPGEPGLVRLARDLAGSPLPPTPGPRPPAQAIAPEQVTNPT
jgi:cyclic beta-1,2-glucan synthetase